MNAQITNCTKGFFLIDDTSAHPGLTIEGGILAGVNGAVIAAAVGGFTANALDDWELMPGQFLPVNLTSLTLTSGEVLCFY